MKRHDLIKLANETVLISEKGIFTNSKGTVVDLSKEMEHCINETILYKPEVNFNINKRANYNTIIEVTEESSLEASRRLKTEFNSVVCLNFASAKYPGGGFLNGSVAQEESLARSSGLYKSLITKPEMYEYNKKLGTCLYSDYIIYSSEVPVFRNDNGDLLDDIYTVSFITSPAVNTGVVRSKENIENQKKIDKTMRERIKKILKIGIIHGNECIVLGAYGCGVFKNKPEDVANYFKHILLYDNEIKGKYKKIVFAIYKDKKNITAFKNILKVLKQR